MSDSDSEATGDVGGTAARQYRLRCPSCKGIMVCDETIVDTAGSCSECGYPVNVDAYACLRELVERKRAAEVAAKERREAEKVEREQERMEEKVEREQKRMEEKARAEEERQHQKQVSVQRRAEERQRDQEQVRRTTLQEAASIVPTIPTYRALELFGTVLAAIGWIYVVGGACCLVLGLVGLIGGLWQGSEFGGMAGAGLGVFCLLWAVAGLIIGLLWLAASEVLRAIRDMALNSWKQVILLQDIERRPRP